jgi:hypothetical protein
MDGKLDALYYALGDDNVFDIVDLPNHDRPAAFGANLGFLRVLRTARLLRSYKCSAASRSCPRGVGRNDEVIRTALDLAVFILTAPSPVYITQHGTNEKIADFVDALYFGGALHHRLRRRHPDRQHLRRTALGGHDDRRHHVVLPPRPGRVPARRQGVASVPAMRSAAPRPRRRPLQGVRARAERPGRQE